MSANASRSSHNLLGQALTEAPLATSLQPAAPIAKAARNTIHIVDIYNGFFTGWPLQFAYHTNLISMIIPAPEA